MSRQRLPDPRGLCADCLKDRPDHCDYWFCKHNLCLAIPNYTRDGWTVSTNIRIDQVQAHLGALEYGRRLMAEAVHDAGLGDTPPREH